MERKMSTDEQIAYAPRQIEAGTPTRGARFTFVDLSRRPGGFEHMCKCVCGTHCDWVLSDCLIALVPDEAGLEQERQHHASAQQSDRHFPAVWRLAGPGAAHVQPVEGITGEYPGSEGDQQLESLYKSLSECALHARILA